MPRVFLRWRPRSFSLTTARSLTTTPKHSMYAIFAYSGVVLGGQWGGIYGSPMECLGHGDCRMTLCLAIRVLPLEHPPS